MTRLITQFLGLLKSVTIYKDHVLYISVARANRGCRQMPPPSGLSVMNMAGIKIYNDLERGCNKRFLAYKVVKLGFVEGCSRRVFKIPIGSDGFSR